MSNLTLFGKPFTQLTTDEAMARVMAARKLRRLRLPEKVRKAPKAKSTTLTKAKKLSVQKTFENMPEAQKAELLKMMLKKRQEELNG